MWFILGYVVFSYVFVFVSLRWFMTWLGEEDSGDHIDGLIFLFSPVSIVTVCIALCVLLAAKWPALGKKIGKWVR